MRAHPLEAAGFQTTKIFPRVLRRFGTLAADSHEDSFTLDLSRIVPEHLLDEVCSISLPLVQCLQPSLMRARANGTENHFVWDALCLGAVRFLCPSSNAFNNLMRGSCQ